MPFRRTFALSAIIAVLVGLPLAADWPVTETLDLDAIYRIKEEGLQRSKVMEIESYLTDVYGPRLTGSPNMKEAADWTTKTMKEWGLANVHLESWPFGRGWQNRRFVALALSQLIHDAPACEVQQPTAKRTALRIGQERVHVG